MIWPRFILKITHIPIPFPKAAFDIVAIATSAGGLRALGQILSALPSTFPAAIVVVQHLAPQYCSLMANILGRQTSLSVKEAEEGDRTLAQVL